MAITASVSTMYKTGFSTGSGTVGGYKSGDWAVEIIPDAKNNSVVNKLVFFIPVFYFLSL